MANSKMGTVTQPGQAEDKKKALETAIAQIEKNFGKGAIMRLGDDIPVNVEAIPTGSLSLDLALGIDGVPRGRIVEIYGEREESPEKRLRDKDKRRAAYYQVYTDMTWGDARHYHVALDSGVLGIETCVSILAGLY